MEYNGLWVHLTAVVKATCWEYKESQEGKMYCFRHVTALLITMLMCEVLDYTIGIKPIIEILPAFYKVKSNQPRQLCA